MHIEILLSYGTVTTSWCHFENLPVYKEQLLNPTPLCQVSKQTLNHGKELESKQCQWLVGLCRCKEFETEAM